MSHGDRMRVPSECRLILTGSCHIDEEKIVNASNCVPSNVMPMALTVMSVNPADMADP